MGWPPEISQGVLCCWTKKTQPITTADISKNIFQKMYKILDLSNGLMVQYNCQRER